MLTLWSCSSRRDLSFEQHVAHVGGQVAKSKSSSQEKRCKKSLEDASKKKREKIVCDLNLREEVNVSRVGGEAEDEVTCLTN